MGAFCPYPSTSFNRLYIMHPSDKIVVIGSALAFMALAFILHTF
jgi:hypothetical protein